MRRIRRRTPIERRFDGERRALRRLISGLSNEQLFEQYGELGTTRAEIARALRLEQKQYQRDRLKAFERPHEERERDIAKQIEAFENA